MPDITQANQYTIQYKQIDTSWQPRLFVFQSFPPKDHKECFTLAELLEQINLANIENCLKISGDFGTEYVCFCPTENLYKKGLAKKSLLNRHIDMEPIIAPSKILSVHTQHQFEVCNS